MTMKKPLLSISQNCVFCLPNNEFKIAKVNFVSLRVISFNSRFVFTSVNWRAVMYNKTRINICILHTLGNWCETVKDKNLKKMKAEANVIISPEVVCEGNAWNHRGEPNSDLCINWATFSGRIHKDDQKVITRHQKKEKEKKTRLTLFSFSVLWHVDSP